MGKHINIYLIGALLFSLLLFVSCKNGKSMFEADNGIVFDTLNVVEESHLNNNPSKPSCNLTINYVYPIKSSKTDISLLQKLFIENILGHSYNNLSEKDAIKQYSANYIENYKNDAQAYNKNVKRFDQMPITSDSDTAEINDEKDPSSPIFYSYSEDLSDSIVYNHNGILSFQVKQSSSKGGTISYISFKNYVINLKTGTLLTENDIFMPGYDEQLHVLFISSLLDQNDVQTTSDLEDLGYFGVEEIAPNNNFLINDNGITYTFNKGEYSAYQLNTPTIFLPFNVIRPFLKENTILSKLTKN